jgi:CRP-like cAMP-binding protein
MVRRARWVKPSIHGQANPPLRISFTIRPQSRDYQLIAGPRLDTDTKRTLSKLAAGLSPESQRQLEYLFCLVELGHGETLCESGRHSQSLYVLHSGVLRVSVKRGNNVVHVPTMHRGDWVGEVCLLDPGPATADVSVLGAAAVLEFTHDALKNFMAKDPVGASQLLSTLMNDLANRLHRTSDSLIKFERSTALLTDPPREKISAVEGLFTNLFGVHKNQPHAR